MMTPSGFFTPTDTDDARRPPAQFLADTLAALDPLPPDLENALSTGELRNLVFQWVAVLETTTAGEFAGLTDDLRELATHLPAASGEISDVRLASDYRPALHRAGLSLERMAVWGNHAGLTENLLNIGRQFVAFSEKGGLSV